MHGCDYATVLRNRIAVSFFSRCFLPAGISRSLFAYPLSYATKCFIYPSSYAEMRLIINESVRPYFAAFSRLSTITVFYFHIFFRIDAKCESTITHTIFLVTLAKNRDWIILSGINRFAHMSLIYADNVLHSD